MFLLFCYSTKNEPCNNGIEAPLGKLIMCRQHYITVTLKAYNDEEDIVDEKFYYPSHCTCEIVKLIKSLK